VDRYFGQNLSLFVRYNHAPSGRTEPIEGGIPSNFNDLSNTHLIPSGQPFYPVSWTNGDSCATAIAEKRKERKRMEKD